MNTMRIPNFCDFLCAAQQAKASTCQPGDLATAISTRVGVRIGVTDELNSFDYKEWARICYAIAVCVWSRAAHDPRDYRFDPERFARDVEAFYDRA